MGIVSARLCFDYSTIQDSSVVSATNVSPTSIDIILERYEGDSSILSEPSTNNPFDLFTSGHDCVGISEHDMIKGFWIDIHQGVERGHSTDVIKDHRSGCYKFRDYMGLSRPRKTNNHRDVHEKISRSAR